MNDIDARGAGLGDNLAALAGAYDLTPDQREMLDQVDRYARDTLYPMAQRMDDEEWWPEEA
ncbi:MAG: hypothetical protein KDE22_06310, partial [Rhodobacterales bacterium]|nr:hypothetical protein [Rhodobacterales bacterium]